MRRDFVIMVLLGLALTGLGLAAAQLDYLPAARSDKGEEIEKAFKILMIFSMPVFGLVLAALIYSLLRFRSRGRPARDGVPLRGTGLFPKAWFAVTSALAATIMIYPGLTSLGDLTRNENPELTVKIDSAQWRFVASYPELGISTLQELVLPVDRNIRFEVTSLDVIHSFYIPAFLMKIDAVPGKTTVITLRPTETASYETDELMRVQCAELCGLDHASMWTPVRVVSEEEFQAWVAGQQPAASPTAEPGALQTRVELAASGSRFSTDRIEVPAGAAVLLTLDNQDAAVHNIAFYRTGDSSQPLPGAATQLLPGPVVQELQFTAPEAGTYYFRCDAHPVEMAGVLEVK